MTKLNREIGRIVKKCKLVAVLILTISYIQYRRSQSQTISNLVHSQKQLISIDNSQKFRIEHIPVSTLPEYDYNFWITDYYNWAIERKRDKNHPKLIVKVFNGLGDQFKAILHYYIYARVTKRVLYIKLIGGIKLDNVFASHVAQLFQLPNQTNIRCTKLRDARSNPNKIIKTLYEPGDVCFTVRNGPKTGKRYWRRIAMGYDSYCSTNLNQHHYGKECENIGHKMRKLSKVTLSTFRGIYRNVFHFSDHIQLLYKDIMMKHNLCMDNNLFPQLPSHKYCHRFIAVHARIGTGVNESLGDRFKNVNGGKMESVARNMVRVSWKRAMKEGLGAEDGITRIYLATDTEEFRPIFDRAVKEMDKNISVIHGERSIHVANMARDRDTFVTDYQRTLAEVVVVSSAENIVSIRSGFSLLAFAYGRGRCIVYNRDWREDICEGYLRDDDDANYTINRIH